MNRETRETLNKLSKQVFGSSSKWQKLVNDGVAEPHERDREVMVPRGDGSVAKKIFTDKKLVLRRYSVEEVTKLMLDVLAARNNTILPAEPLHSVPSAQLVESESLVNQPEPNNDAGSPQEVTLNK